MWNTFLFVTYELEKRGEKEESCSQQWVKIYLDEYFLVK